MPAILEVIENKDVKIEATNYYAAILGTSPSKGARSPILWNAAFKRFSLAVEMYPLDITSENLQSAVQFLKKDDRFIGGAVTMPYKIDIIPFLDVLEPEAEIIGAVNCLYRQDNKLAGTNTDGAGALWSLQNEYGSIKNKTVLLVGTGGAGFAVAAYLAQELGKNGKLILANRKAESRKSLEEKVRGQCSVESVDRWPVDSRVGPVDILVNCTSIGFENGRLKDFSPLGSLEDVQDNILGTRRILEGLQRPFVFDIIYQPRETALLKAANAIGCRTLNGLPMNLEQAVIAFDKATTAKGLNPGTRDEIRSAMSLT